MKKMKASEFKAKCLKVLDDVERTGETVLILKRGRVVARLASPLVRSERAPWQELLGKMEVTGDVVGPAVPTKHWRALSGRST
ncbi:MAG: type II toxin-antitoxin system Phd/YefM family antitoxin [Myxococcaceae bacterium]